MPHNAVSHIQQQYAAHHPQCNTFALDKPKSAAYGYTAVFIAFNNADGTPTNETLTPRQHPRCRRILPGRRHGLRLHALLQRRTGQPAHLPPHHGHQLRRIQQKVCAFLALRHGAYLPDHRRRTHRQSRRVHDQAVHVRQQDA